MNVFFLLSIIYFEPVVVHFGTFKFLWVNFLGSFELIYVFSYYYMLHVALMVLFPFIMVNMYFLDFFFFSYVLLPSFLINFRSIVSFETVFNTS